MIFFISARETASGRYSIVACSVAKLTVAVKIPSVRLSVFSTLFTQDAQLIPSMGIMMLSTLDSYPRSWIVPTNIEGLVSSC